MLSFFALRLAVSSHHSLFDIYIFSIGHTTLHDWHKPSEEIQGMFNLIQLEIAYILTIQDPSVNQPDNNINYQNVRISRLNMDFHLI